MFYDKVEAEIRREEYAEWLASDEKKRQDEIHRKVEEAKAEYLASVKRPVWNDNVDENGIEPNPLVDGVIITIVDGLPALARWDTFKGSYRVEGRQVVGFIKAPDIKHWYPAYPESELMFA